MLFRSVGKECVYVRERRANRRARIVVLTSECVNDVDDVLLVGDNVVDSIVDKVQKVTVERVLQWHSEQIQQVNQQRRGGEDVFRYEHKSERLPAGNA